MRLKCFFHLFIFINRIRNKQILFLSGTEASAAAAAVIVEKLADISTPFRVNRPFFFGIYNEQAQIFTFLGKIEDPNPNQD